MTNNTQSLLDRMAEALRDVTEVVEMTIGFGLFDHSEPREGSPALKAQQVLAEYEAHKANHTEDMRGMVKARQCDAVKPRELSPELREALAQAIDALYVQASESNNEMFSAGKRAKAALVRSFLDSALGVINPIQPGSTTS